MIFDLAKNIIAVIHSDKIINIVDIESMANCSSSITYAEEFKYFIINAVVRIISIGGYMYHGYVGVTSVSKSKELSSIKVLSICLRIRILICHYHYIGIFLLIVLILCLIHRPQM